MISKEDRNNVINLVNEAHAQGARKHKACELFCISVRTFERWQAGSEQDMRKGSERTVGNKLTEEERALILETVNSVEFRDLPVSQIVPKLADQGSYIASESTFYRILREEKLLAHRHLSKPAKHKKPIPYKATSSNQVWSWDITYLPTQVSGIYYYLYFIMDIFSRKIVGWNIHEVQCDMHAANLIKQACIDENISRNQVVLHSDNGSPMKGATMLAMLEKLGVASSFSRPSVSDDNPYSEALFRTLKYRPDFPITTKFSTLLKSREWVTLFVEWYNYRHMHSALKFVTPAQRHTGDDLAIHKKRNRLYLQAKNKHPERWSGKTRDWSLPTEVFLNPNKKSRNNATYDFTMECAA